MTDVLVSGSFDNLGSRQMRFLDEAARLGRLRVALWSDAIVEAVTTQPPRFPQAERRYLLEAIRYVDEVAIVGALADPDAPPHIPGARPDLWAWDEADDTPARRARCHNDGLNYRVLRTEDLSGFPVGAPAAIMEPDRPRVMVTGCYDWLHSGHVRFFEEACSFGDLYVVVGSDANVRLLKGKEHPLFRQDQRRYMVGSIRHVTQALVSSGTGWMDAEPEIARIRPHRYAVNEDGDRPEKRAFCEAHGIEYVILRRAPKEGLPRRASTELRGF